VNNNLMLLDNCVNINGEYYTVSNGFVTKAYGEIQLRYKDLLAVEFVKHRSKKMMYAMLLPAGVLMFAWNLDGIVSIAIIAILAVIICFMAILYLSSVRQFVEFTSMKGTYRIAVQRDDTGMVTLVAQLQGRINTTK